MFSLKTIIEDARARKAAVGHFNISDLASLKAIAEAARELNAPVIIGVSEGERDFMDVHGAAALVKDLRENHGQPIFINADHTHSFEKAKEAVDAGYDAVLFDGSRLPMEENISQTIKVFEYAKSKNPDILIEGELGYIGSSSKILKEIPEGAAVKPEDLTKPEEAAEFARRTGINLLAPAVGNIHGMLADIPNPRLNIDRVKEIGEAVGIPLVLHGGSGIVDSDFLAAIDAGIAVIHISTELRVAWRKGIEVGLRENPEEITPYKILPAAVDEIKRVVYNRLKLFNGD